MKALFFLFLFLYISAVFSVLSNSALGQRDYKRIIKRDLSTEEVCFQELNAGLRRENEALLDLQRCTEEKCKLDLNNKRERCRQKDYTFNPELDMCYKVYSTLTVCRNAITKCAGDSGRLATLNTEDKKVFFTNVLKQNPSADGIMTGGHYDLRDGVWRWEDGSNIGQLNWGRSGTEPTSAKKDECIGIYQVENYTWHDFIHTHQLMFICELI